MSKENTTILFNYKYYLRRIEEIKKEILDFDQYIEDLRDTGKGVSYDGIKTGPTGSVGDPTGQRVEMIVTLQEQQVKIWKEELEELYGFKNKVERFLRDLKEIERRYIQYRFFKKMQYRQIAAMTNYSQETYKKMNKRLLEQWNAFLKI